MEKNEKNKMLCVEKAAEYIGVSVGFLRTLIKPSKFINTGQGSGKKGYYHLDKLKKLKQERQKKKDQQKNIIREKLKMVERPLPHDKWFIREEAEKLFPNAKGKMKYAQSKLVTKNQKFPIRFYHIGEIERVSKLNIVKKSPSRKIMGTYIVDSDNNQYAYKPKKQNRKCPRCKKGTLWEGEYVCKKCKNSYYNDIRKNIDEYETYGSIALDNF